MAKKEENKVVIVGQPGVGKTCILKQFVQNTFDDKEMSSLTSQYEKKTIKLVNGEDITFDIYDTAGQERFRSLAKIFYKDARVVILVYNITNKKSFEEMKNYWYEQVKNIPTKNLILAIAGNKCDLYNERQVKTIKGEEFAKSINAIFVETSAKNDSGIDKLFENIGYKILDPHFNFFAEEEKKKKKYGNIKKEVEEKEEEEEKEEPEEEEEKGNIKITTIKEEKKETEETEQNIEQRESFRVTTQSFNEPKKHSKLGCCK